MENGPYKILLISGDENSARRISELVCAALATAEVTIEPTADAGLAMVATNNFSALLFEVPHANASALFQITSLTTQAPRLPVLAIGPSEDEMFLAEAVFSGAQEYLGREQLSARRWVTRFIAPSPASRSGWRWSRRKIIITASSIISWKAFSAPRSAAITCWRTSRWRGFTVTTRRCN